MAASLGITVAKVKERHELMLSIVELTDEAIDNISSVRVEKSMWDLAKTHTPTMSTIRKRFQEEKAKPDEIAKDAKNKDLSPVKAEVSDEKKKHSISLADEKFSELATANYENCYNLINEEAEDFIGTLLNKKNNNVTLAEYLASRKTLTVEDCKRFIANISAVNYDEETRKRFVAYNFRLSCLGVAPRWRGIQRDRYFKVGGDDVTSQQKTFMRDVQVFDMEWIHRRYRGHLVDTSWNGAFEGIFTSAQFDTKKAAIIAEMEIKPSKKCDYLMLSTDMQHELHMLRTRETDTLIESLLQKSRRVENDLRLSAQRNKKRGKKLLKKLGVRTDLWIAANLSDGVGLSVIMDNYTIMTGKHLTRSNCHRLLKSLNQALEEVGSKYVLNL